MLVVAVAVAAAVLFFPGQAEVAQKETNKELAYRIARREGIEAALVGGIIRQESNWVQSAFNPEGDGSDPSIGLIQVRLSTANSRGSFLPGEWLGEVSQAELFDPAVNVQTGARALRWMMADVAHWPGDTMKRGITLEEIDAYNVGVRGRQLLGRSNLKYRRNVLAERKRLLEAGVR